MLRSLVHDTESEILGFQGERDGRDSNMALVNIIEISWDARDGGDVHVCVCLCVCVCVCVCVIQCYVCRVCIIKDACVCVCDVVSGQVFVCIS
jgi:hypothetical protein